LGKKRLESWRSAKLVHRPPICVRILFSGEQYAVEVQRTQQNAGQSDKLRKFAKICPWCRKSAKLSSNCVGHPGADLTNLKGPGVRDLFQTVLDSEKVKNYLWCRGTGLRVARVSSFVQIWPSRSPILGVGHPNLKCRNRRGPKCRGRFPNVKNSILLFKNFCMPVKTVPTVPYFSIGQGLFYPAGQLVHPVKISTI
jgi:hypothetical protein